MASEREVIMSEVKNLIGRKSGRLTVVRSAGRKRWDETRTEAMWVCLCKCGIETTIAQSKIGKTKSCGCSRKGNSYASKWERFGGYNTPEYRAWRCMLARCGYEKDKEYARYGGRGIRVCAEWLTDYAAFREYIGPRPAPGYTVDRIETNGNYEPGNVRWVTRKVQARNRRRQHRLTIGGATKTLAEWAENAGVNYETALWRFNRGWTPEEVLKPVP
jgi:hypothetical protein